MKIAFLKQWEVYFDGTSRSLDGTRIKDVKKIDGVIGIVFVSPRKQFMLHFFLLLGGCSNNELEYEALITGLKMP